MGFRSAIKAFLSPEKAVEVSPGSEYGALLNLVTSTRETLYTTPYSKDPLLRANPDPVVARRGYAQYSKVLADPVVSSAVEIAVLGMLPSWNIVPGGGPGQGEAGAELIRRELDNFPGSPLDLFHDEMMSPTFVMGFTVGESIWGIDRNGTARLVDYLTRPHSTIRFLRNPHGRNLGPVQTVDGKTYPFPEYRTVHLSHKGGRSNPFGAPGLRPIYDPWMDKVDAMVAWAVFLKRRGSGLAYVKVPKDKYDDAGEMQQLLTIMTNVQGSDLAILPDYLEVEWIEAAGGGAADLYTSTVNQKNAEITRGILGVDTAVAEAIRVGARADTQGKADTMWTLLRIRGQKLREQISEGLFRPLVRWNLPGEPCPRLETEEAKPLDAKERLSAWAGAYARGLLPAPSADEQVQLLIDLGVDVDRTLGIEVGGGSAGGDPQKAALNGSQIASLVSIVVQMKTGVLTRDQAIGIAKMAFPSFTDLDIESAIGQVEQSQAKEISAQIAARGPALLAQAANRKRYIRQRKDRLKAIDSATAEVVGVYQANAGKALEKLLKDIFPGGKLRETRVNEAGETVKVTPSWLRDNIRILGKGAVQKKLFDVAWTERGRGSEHATANVKVLASTTRLGTQALSRTTAMDLLRNDIYYTIQKTYGALEESIWHEINLVLRGRASQAEVIGNIRQILFMNGMTDPRGGITTVVRTNLATAYNDGRDMVYSRHESLLPSGAPEGSIIGYEVYSTLDDVTTEECEKLHGMNFLVGDTDMPYFPRHMNCRGDKFPIFAGEEPTSGHWLTDSERKTVRANPPGKGFGGARGLTRSWRA